VVSLETVVSGITFKNPIIIGSAGYAEDENGLKRFIKRGYGGVVTKSTAETNLAGAPPPRVFWYDPYRRSYLDGSEAHRGPGIEKISASVRACKDLAEREDCKIIGSISCGSIEEAKNVAAEFEKAGVSALEIDMQCGVVGEHLGKEYAGRGSYWADPEHPERAIELIKALKNAVDIPIWPKILPNTLYLVGDMIEKKSKPDAFPYMGFTFPIYPPGLMINIDSSRPIFNGNTLLKIQKGQKFYPVLGALPYLGMTILATAVLKNKLKSPLLPSGGIRRGFDVVQAMMAGANAVEICTAAYRDLNVIDNILRELKWFMSKGGYAKIGEIVGIAQEHIPFELMEIPVHV
jgi:dihydroorotate dehydrogenase